MNTVSRILAGLLAVAACGCSEHESCQGLTFASAEELNVFQQEVATLGFRGGGHSDGNMTDAQGIRYAVAGYNNTGEYEGLKTHVAIRICTPSEASRQPINRSALIHCWSRSKTKADATSLRLKNEIELRVKEKMVNQGMNILRETASESPSLISAEDARKIAIRETASMSPDLIRVEKVQTGTSAIWRVKYPGPLDAAWQVDVDPSTGRVIKKTIYPSD